MGKRYINFERNTRDIKGVIKVFILIFPLSPLAKQTSAFLISISAPPQPG